METAHTMEIQRPSQYRKQSDPPLARMAPSVALLRAIRAIRGQGVFLGGDLGPESGLDNQAGVA
jgi:hypothetical protein